MALIIFCRLQEHFEEDLDQGHQCCLTYIYARYKEDGGQCDYRVVGKIIRRIFKNAMAKKIQIKRRNVTLFGIKERDFNSDIKSEYPCTFSSIPEWIPSTFMICAKTSEEIHVAVLGDVINGYQTVNKIIFKSSGVWHFIVGGKDVNLPDILINPNFQFTPTSVQNICSLVTKIRLCRGRDGICNMDHYNYTIEFLGETKTKIYRSNNCKKVVKFISLSSTCKRCKVELKMSIQPTFKEIVADKTVGREKSHQRLLACVKENKDYFHDGKYPYLRSELRKLCLAYDVSVFKNACKKECNDALIEAITQCDLMPNPDMLTEGSVPISCSLSSKEIPMGNSLEDNGQGISTGPPPATAGKSHKSDKNIEMASQLSARVITSTIPQSINSKSHKSDKNNEITSPLSLQELPSTGSQHIAAGESHRRDKNIEIPSPLSSKVIPSSGPPSLAVVICNKRDKNLALTWPIQSKKNSGTGPLSITSETSHKCDINIEIAKPLSSKEISRTGAPSINAHLTHKHDKNVEPNQIKMEGRANRKRKRSTCGRSKSKKSKEVEELKQETFDDHTYCFPVSV